ncbi:hypothetical protein QAD02_010004 [Eretmocerus hayati]|uniref:Uncharacterized protein n=1 Tax=Eretmocerus hayati TaxID=131215 RepID=A0ACC2NBQ0_9HYME|nr:hypothetical protein QAD02_010004 [Eretmocerus hayati]
MEQRRIMKESYKICKFILYFYMTTVFCAISANGLARLAALWEYGFNKYTDLDFRNDKLMYIICEFGFDVSESPKFELIWLLQLATGYIGAIVYVASDVFVIILLSHACTQLKNLRHDLSHMDFSCADEDFPTMIRGMVNQHLRCRR